MKNNLEKLYHWLNKNSLKKEAAKISFIVKLANKMDENKLFNKYQKLENMFLAAEKSEDQSIRTEGKTAKRMAEKLKAKYKEKTGKDFETEYLSWKGHSPEASSGVGSSYYQPKATYPEHLWRKYDWRNYYNEMEELLRGFYQAPGLVTPSTEVGMQGGPTPGQFDARLDHIVGDFLDRNLSEEQANELLGEDNSEWLMEMAAEMRAERALTGYYQAQEREAQKTEALGHPSWMSPNDLMEMEEREHYLNWRNHIEAEGTGELLGYLNSNEKEYHEKMDGAEPGLVRSEGNPIIRIQKNEYSKPIMIRREELLRPDAKPNDSIYYGVTKLDYAVEYMGEEFEKIINEDDNQYYNEYMEDLFDNANELFSKFQRYESEDEPGGNDLVDHMMKELNAYGRKVADKIVQLNKDIYDAMTWSPTPWRRQNAQVFPSNIRLSRSEGPISMLEEAHGNFYRSNTRREKVLLRFLYDVEEEVSGRRIHRLKHAYNKEKYPFIFFIDDLKEIHGFLYEFGKSISNREKNSEEKSRALHLEFIDIKEKIASLPEFKNVFKHCLLRFDRVRE